MEGSRARVQRTRPECMRTIHTTELRAACKRKIYGVQQPFARGLCREKGKEAKRRHVLGSKATPFHAGGYYISRVSQLGIPINFKSRNCYIYIILQLYYPRRKKEKKEYKKNASSLRLIVILKQLEHEWIDANGGKKERKKKNRNCTSINNKFRNNVGKRWIFSEEEGDDYGRKNSIVAKPMRQQPRVVTGGKNGCNEVAFTADNDPESQLDGETRGEGSTTIQWNFHGICTYKETEDG